LVNIALPKQMVSPKMRYDYDMFSIIPDEVQGQFQEMFNDLGVNDMTSQQKGLWRDTDVVEALLGADQVVKDLFNKSGFGVNHYFSGAPEGRFFARETKARQQIEDAFLAGLSDGLDNGSLQGTNWNGFVLEDFLEYIETARPIDEVDVAQMHAKVQKASKAKARKKLVALGVLIVGVLTIGYAATSILMGPVSVAAL